MSIVQNILKIAKEHKVNNQQLCKILNTNSSKIYDWKVGKSKPSADDICILANYFNVSTDYLLGRTNTQATTYSVNNINDGSVVQGNGSVFGNASISVASTSENDSNNISLSKEEIGILDLYRSLDIRDRAKFMNFVFDMEDKATKA